MSNLDWTLAFAIRFLVFHVGFVTFRPRAMTVTMSMPVVGDDVGLSVPYTVDELIAIVDVHNQKRGNVIPSAADMEFVRWDEELAAAADGWAVKCTLEHGKPENSTISRFGQNIWAGFGLSKWALPETVGPFRAWTNEDRFYDYETNSCQARKMCGHYTQIIWASTRAVGCGRAFCRQTDDIPFARWMVVCNYLPGGNIQGRQPYITGPSCSRCSSGNGECYKNKCRPCSEHTEPCECNLQCQNCGTLDRETCTCTCPKGWHGNECGKPCVDTHQYCGRSPGWPGRVYCPFAPYIPRYCPLMCGVCEAEDPDFVCVEDNAGWKTRDALTTLNTDRPTVAPTDKTEHDDITDNTGTRSYGDITKGPTTLSLDVTSASFLMTTLDVEIASPEKQSTKYIDEASGEKEEGLGLDKGVTTPSTTGLHWLEQLEGEVPIRGNQVNYAAKSINSEVSNQVRSLKRNASSVNLNEVAEVSAQNGIRIDKKVESIDDNGDIILTTRTPLSTTHETNSIGNSSTSSVQDAVMARTEATGNARLTNADSTGSHTAMFSSRHLYSTESPSISTMHSSTTDNPDQGTEEHSTPNANLSLVTSTQVPLQPSYTATKSEGHSKLEENMEENDNSQSPPTSAIPTARYLENFLEGSSLPTTNPEGHTRSLTIAYQLLINSTNSVTSAPSIKTSPGSGNIEVTTDSTPGKHLSTLNTTNNQLQTEYGGGAVQPVTDATSEDVVNASMARERLGFIPEDLCKKTFTAVAMVDDTVFLFQGHHLWWVNMTNGKTLSSDKETVQSYFGLEGQKVTAAVYRQSVDEWTLFTYMDVFTIRNHSQTQKTRDYHRMRVTELGIPFGAVVDAAFHDDRRKKWYLLTNRWVWRYDDERDEVDIGYPRRSQHEFRGLMRHRPSAAVTINGKLFILFGEKYAEINQDIHRVDEWRVGNYFEDHFDCFINYN
nr:uncharacterized protein LOC129268996 isoform X2 [Lytechinus pictus]